jgi:hypothetical protein
MLDLDKIMQSIREEIARQDAAAASSGPQSSSPPKHASKFDEMLKMTDADFVKSAYREVLGREVDPGALSNLTEELKFGMTDRLLLLRELQQSEEGRKFGARLTLPLEAGRSWQKRLDPRALLQRILGIRWLVKFGKQLKAADRGPLKLATLPYHLQDLKLRIGSIEFAVSDVQKMAAQQQALIARVAKLEARLRDLNDGSQGADGIEPRTPTLSVAHVSTTEISGRALP